MKIGCFLATLNFKMPHGLGCRIRVGELWMFLGPHLLKVEMEKGKEDHKETAC